FIILNKEMVPVSHSSEARSFSMLAASDKIFLNEANKRPQLLSSFDKPNLQSSTSTLSMMGRPQYSFVSSSIQGTDLYLLSFVPLDSFWSSAVQSLAFVFSALAATWMLLFAYMSYGRRKDASINQWVKTVFEGLK